jgi:hypothetical protein
MATVYQGRRTFILGFIAGILICVGLNIYSLVANYRGKSIDDYGPFGFPVHFGDQWLFIGGEISSWPGFAIDVGFAVLVGALIGLIARSTRSRFRPLE